ncbi:hypothetical protein Palpr_2313 [Paludibacter propionicigenes WB4]|uniref:Uncharacterized protein n=1 Tax=Paludibacter propionicigenes (strain DSM 17365 / JCM 13257 / WB4) TaxID=694427 RepID=E4T6V4_PALPW|nr:hypothetical protein Palpr_2313 [Paludibacter propionicigenes WB4]
MQDIRHKQHKNRSVIQIRVGYSNVFSIRMLYKLEFFQYIITANQNNYLFAHPTNGELLRKSIIQINYFCVFWQYYS